MNSVTIVEIGVDFIKQHIKEDPIHISGEITWTA